MLWFFCFIFCFTFFVGSEADVIAAGDDKRVCGISPAVERYQIYNPNRIFGGEHSKNDDFPWYVYQFADNQGCSGTIIHERWILTAAHCFNYQVNNQSYIAFYGSADFAKMKNISGLEYFIHPKYATDGSFDLTLAKLNESLEFSETVQPVCLDSTVNPEENEILTIAGMGADFKMRRGDKMTQLPDQPILQDAPILYNKTCDSENQICVGGVNHVGLPGDSGGPLMVIRDNRFIQVGVCHGFKWEGFGDESLSAVFTEGYIKVSNFCDWIKSTTNNEVQC